MKVLKQGDGQHWTLEVLCELKYDSNGLAYDSDIEHCGSLLEIDKNDVEYNTWQKMYDKGADYIVRCPICKSRLYLKDSLIPEYVKKIARKKYDEKEAERQKLIKEMYENNNEALDV